MQGVQGDSVPLHNAAQVKIDFYGKFLKTIDFCFIMLYN